MTLPIIVDIDNIGCWWKLADNTEIQTFQQILFIFVSSNFPYQYVVHVWNVGPFMLDATEPDFKRRKRRTLALLVFRRYNISGCNDTQSSNWYALFLLRQKFLAAAIFSRLIFAVMEKKTKWQVRVQKIEPGCRTKKLVRKERKRKYTRERTSPPCLRCSPMKRPNETSKRNCIPSRVLSGSQE